MCIPLVLRVRDVIGGWEYSCMVFGSVSLRGCGGDVGVCGCGWGVGEGGAFSFGVSCDVRVLVAAVGEGPGRVHPLHWLMCSCVVLACSVCLLVRLKGCFFLVDLCMEGLRVCRRGSVWFVCVLVVCVVSLRMWVSEFHGFVVGSCVLGGVCTLLGFVACYFVRYGSDGCGVVMVRVRMDCCWLCAGWHRFRVSSGGQLLDDAFKMGIKLSG